MAFAALTAAGIPPHVAFAAILVSPTSAPSGSSSPVVLYYLLPSLATGVLLAVGLLWVPA